MAPEQDEVRDEGFGEVEEAIDDPIRQPLAVVLFFLFL